MTSLLLWSIILLILLKILWSPPFILIDHNTNPYILFCNNKKQKASASNRQRKTKTLVRDKRCSRSTTTRAYKQEKESIQKTNPLTSVLISLFLSQLYSRNMSISGKLLPP